jgi:pSer/pThr/pTyr-binding forkhead associated (FHA) protein
MGPLIVEVLDERGGRARERHRLAASPVTIGRGYACDVVVDDPYVSVEHLRVEWDDQGWRILDLASENGTYLATGRRIGSERLGAEAVLRIGHTRLRLRTGEYAAPPALRDRGEAPRLGLWLDRPIAAVLALAAVGALAAFDAHQRTFTTSAGSAAGLGALFALSVTSGWASLWALFTRLLSHRPRLFAHLGVAGLAFVGWEVADWLVQFYAFAFSARVTSQVLEYALAGAVGAVALYLHCGLAASRSGWRPAALAGLATATIVAVSGTASYLIATSDENVSELSFAAELKPLPLALTRRESLERFLADAESLRARVDAEAQTPGTPGAEPAR